MDCTVYKADSPLTVGQSHSCGPQACLVQTVVKSTPVNRSSGFLVHLSGSWEPALQASQIGFLSVALTECLCPHSLAHFTLTQVTCVKSEEFRPEQQVLADTDVKRLVNLAPPRGLEAGLGDCSSRSEAGGRNLLYAVCAAPAVPHCEGENPPRVIWNKRWRQCHMGN